VLPLADAPGQPPRIEPQFRDAADASAPSPVVQELYRAAVGEKNRDYYLRQFARFDQAGKTGASWHWPASLSTLNWLAWRGMWSAALAFAALCLTLGLLVFGIGRLVFDFSPTTELILLALCLALVFFLPGLFANAAYYRFSKKRIEAALAACATIDEACASLAAQASSNRRWFVLAVTNSSLVVVIGLFTWLLTSTGSFEASAPTPPSQPVLATAIEPPAASPTARAKTSDSTSTPTAAPMAASEPMASVAAAASAPLPPAPPPAPLQLADAPPVPARALAARPPTSTSSAAATATAVGASAPASGAAAVRAGAASAASAAPAAAEFRFALQVGAFANEENARKAQAKLEAAGFKAYLEDLQTSQGKRIRVRVGPFATRAEAEKAAPQVKALDLPALLVKS